MVSARRGMNPARRQLHNPDDARLKALLDVVLPESDDLPTLPPQSLKVSLVSSTVIRDLVAPERRQSMRPLGESVTVPKVAVYEHNESVASEDKIRTSRQLAHMRTEPKPPPVKRRTEHDLWAGIARAHSRHAVATGGS